MHSIRFWAALLSALIPASAYALDDAATPQNGVVVGGDAVISRPAVNRVTIDQSSQRAVINWQSFNIGKNATTTFNQPNQQALAVNRVTGADGTPTQILGRLKSNGQVMVMDQDGILFGQTAKIDVGGLIAGTGTVDTSAVMASDSGAIQIGKGTHSDAAVINQGEVTIDDHGVAALVAPSARNDGVIVAKSGKVVIAGAETATLDLYGDGLITLAQPANAPVSAGNSGRITAQDGLVVLTTADAGAALDNVVNMDGIITAGDTGKVALTAGQNGDVKISGLVQSGGDTDISADRDVVLRHVASSGVYSTSGDIQVKAGQSIDAHGAARMLSTGDTGKLALSEGTASDLQNLLDAAGATNGATEIKLAGNGPYKGNAASALSNLTVKSADADNRAVIDADHTALTLTGNNVDLQGFDIKTAQNGVKLESATTGDIRLSDMTISGGDGIGVLALNPANLVLQNVTLRDFRQAGLSANDSVVALNNVTFTDNAIGAYLDDSILGLTGTRFDRGDYGLVLNGAKSTLVGNGFGDTLFSGQKTFIQLQDNAFTGQSLDGSAARYVIGKTEYVPGRKMAEATYWQLAARLTDSVDDASLGTINIGTAPPPRPEWIIQQPQPLPVTPERYLPKPVDNAGKLPAKRVTMQSISAAYDTDSADLNAIEPAAGDDGGEEAAPCRRLLSGAPDDMLKAAGSCL